MLEWIARAAHLRRLPQGIVVNAVCRDNQNQEQAGCKDRVEQALVTVNIACAIPIRDVWACAGADFGAKKSEHACPQEHGRLFTCLQARRVSVISNYCGHSAVLVVVPLFVFYYRHVCLGCALFTFEAHKSFVVAVLLLNSLGRRPLAACLRSRFFGGVIRSE